MNATSCLIKTVFCVASFLNCIVGFVLMSVGVGMVALAIPYLEESRSKEGDLKQIADAVPPFLPEPYANFTLPLDEVNEMISSMATGFIAIGAVCFVFGMIGCYALCMKVLLLVYGVCCIIMSIISLVIIAVFSDYLKTFFLDGLQNYHGVADTRVSSLFWTATMSVKQCCGWKNYKDFHSLPNWPTKSMINFTAPTVELLEYLGEVKDAKKIRDLQDEDAEKIRGLQAFGEVKFDDPAYLKTRYGCKTIEVYNISCEWLDSSKYETPIACCKELEDLKYNCHVKGFTNTKLLKGNRGNNMDTGCGEFIGDINDQVNAFLIGLLVYFLVSTFLVGVLLFLKRKDFVKDKNTEAGQTENPENEQGDANKDEERSIEKTGDVVNQDGSLEQGDETTENLSQRQTALTSPKVSLQDRSTTSDIAQESVKSLQ